MEDNYMISYLNQRVSDLEKENQRLQELNRFLQDKLTNLSLEKDLYDITHSILHLKDRAT